jgi:CRISPR/Cas system endoribonuclease Cas6 (RAMP superfamily)
MSNTKTITEDDIVEHIFMVLYSSLHKNELHLENEILKPTNLNFSAEQTEHLRELIVATGFIKNSIGFGKAGFIYLTVAGISIMKQYKSYSAYLHATQGNHAVTFNNMSTEDVEANKQLQHPQNSNEDIHQQDDMAH